jgi:membrane fusion protein (multidrug efflux system)
MMISSSRLPGLLTLLTLTLAVTTACDGSKDATGQAPVIEVKVIDVSSRDVPLSIEMVGTTLGTQDVPIRARVEGFLESVDFEEGSHVTKGSLLYTIDAQPFQAKLVEAQSNLAGAQTQQAKANADLGRIRPLAEIKAVSEQDLDGAVAQEAAARANVRANEAAVDLAEIELSYTRITAPIDGLIGLTKAKPGEFVGREPNPVVLNMLSDIDPIRVRFSISEREYLKYVRAYVKKPGRTRSEDPDGEKLELTLILADGSEHDHTGFSVGSAQAINMDTGTYSLEASFPNPDRLLLPGQFARIRAPYETLTDVVVIPRQSVMELQGLFRAYVVDSTNTIQIRQITLGPVTGNEVVVESGLEAGDSLVVEGLQKIRPGMTVNPTPHVSPTPVEAG